MSDDTDDRNLGSSASLASTTIQENGMHICSDVPASATSNTEKEPSSSASNTEKEPSSSTSNTEKEPSSSASNTEKEPSSSTSNTEKEPSSSTSNTEKEPSPYSTSNSEKESSPNTTADISAATSKIIEDEENGLCHLKTKTSSETNNDQDEFVNMCPNSLGLIPHNIHLYVLRSGKENDKFFIQAIFSSGVKLNFERHKVLNIENDSCPYAYHLNLHLMHNNTGHFCATYEGGSYLMDEYHLRLSLRHFTKSKHFINQRRRPLSDFRSTAHQFLFDTEFSNYNSTEAPGSYITLWRQLYLFTFFIIQQKNYDGFNALIDQFKTVVENEKISFTCTDFNELFSECSIFTSMVPLDSPNKHMIVRDLLRLIGFLHINKDNFSLNSPSTKEFTNKIVRYVAKHLDNFIASVTDDQWLLFKNGLATIIYIYLLIQTSTSSNFITNNYTTLEFLGRISSRNKVEDIANAVLERFDDLKRPISDFYWTELLALISPDRIRLEHLNFNRSFDSYLTCIAKFSRRLALNKNLKENVARHFDNLVQNNHFSIDLDSILFLLKLLTDQSSNITEEIETHKIIHWAIDLSIPLRNKIKDYFLTVNVSIQNIPIIHDIFRISNTSLLFHVDYKSFLIKSLTSSDNTHSSDFYSKWFLHFMALDTKQLLTDRTDLSEFKNLIKKWTECIVRDNHTFPQMVKRFDQLSSVFKLPENNLQLSHFIDKMTDLCFRKGDIYHIIDESLLEIQSVDFFKQFKIKFDTNILTPLRKNVDQRQNNRTPLLRLIEFDKQKHKNNTRLRELISLASQIIEITTDEIIRDTFDQPNASSFIYNVLFEDWSQTLPIHQTTIDQLLAHLISWEDKGLRVGEIAKWKNYSNDEHQVACRIWNYICQQADKQFELDNFIKIEQDKMTEKLRIKDEINLCLMIYCYDAHDRDIYFQHLEDMDKRLENEIVRSINVPKEIHALVSQVTRLSSYSESTVWLKFYEERRQSILTRVNNNDQSVQDQRMCVTLLIEADKIFDLFVDELKSICYNWKGSSISRLIQLFPDSNYIDHDLKTLEPLMLFDTVVVSIFKEILNYWKSHKHIHHICQGCINLMHHLQVSNNDQTLLLTKMLEINEKTSGETFYQIYQDFCEQYSKRYSLQTLNIIAHYSSSDDLIKFLHSLTETDTRNLLEAVNDWDESLVNTKTVLDFVLLKTFLNQTYVQIESTRSEQPLTFDLHQIINCFNHVLNENDFNNILLCFESCSMSLNSIQRVYLDLTDKEQSKRQRILEIMQNASLTFVNQSSMQSASVEYQFDVNVDTQLMAYGDLSELRDRAHLIEYSSDKLKNDSEEEIKNLRLFVSLVELIEIILEHLTLLYISGHPYVSDSFGSLKEFRCDAKDCNGLNEFSNKLKKLLKWEQYLCTMYEQYLELTYFSFHQVWLIEHYLYNQNSTSSKNNAAYHLLKFIGVEPELIKVPGPREKDETSYKRLENIGRILATHRDHKNPSIKHKITTSKNVILTQTSEEGIMRAILSFFRLTAVEPKVNQLFYCTEKTSWVEIRAFMYRCFYSQTLHQLIRPELLTSFIQDQFIRLLRELLLKDSKQHFQLGIITTVSTAHMQLTNGLEALDIVYTYHDQDLFNSSQLQQAVEQYVGKNVVLVTSRIAGLGKSTFIRDAIVKMNRQYIKFPINGDVNADKLAERLSSYGNQLASKQSAIHIDIGTIDNVNQLNELLYCLLLFRGFRLGQVAVHIPTDVPIYIELDASPNTMNLRQKIIIFKYLKTVNIDSMNWQQLKLENLSGIQWVVNYLQSIENKTVNKKDISEATIQSLSPDICCRLLQEYILREKNIEFVTWTKVSIFIAIYGGLFLGFSRCGHFLVDSVKWLKIPQLREDILLSLINSSDQFTSLSVEAVRKNQRSTNDAELVIDFSEAIIRWDTFKAFTLVFTATDDPVFVYKKAENVPESLRIAFGSRSRSILEGFRARQSQSNLLPDYTTLTHAQFFTKLASLSKKYFNKSICLNCFNQYEYTEQACKKCSTQDILVRPRSWESSDIAAFQEMIANRLQDTYVLTPDNYIKMLLIYLRVQSRLPVLIMGETGCGKTSLIQFLCQKILDDEMISFRIHAGVTSEMIVESMHQFIDQAQKCQNMRENKRVWVFFDEFNTTRSIGIIKEIICERTLFGRSLPSNMVFLGACNPKRRKSDKIANDDNIGIKKDRYAVQRLANLTGEMSLLYTVVSIPETMLEYVWDYGFLDEETESKYIRTMLNSCSLLTSNSVWFECTTSLITASQRFFRGLEDASSVSLRDVARFCRLYNWYQKLITIRKSEQMLVHQQIDANQRASLMALLCCYYFRLKSSKDRQAYTKAIQEQMKSFVPNLIKTDNFLEELLRDEQNKLIDEMELPADTAKNRALTENIFVLVACIVNRIPVILCGKPGCSKTSSVQIVISNLKGKKSKVSYFQTLPELISVSYQGSQNCTSESVLKVFKRAEKYLVEKNDTNKLLPVIVFDEIGLAELSPDNPLKVLHNELEVESCRFGFVGLSNWRLDASKMNRAIYVSCPDPDINDLQLTAKAILKSMFASQEQGVRLSDSIIHGLADAYADLHEHINQDEQYNNYFGLRDYYALIKGVIQDSIRAREDPFVSIRRQLSVNFDGVFNGSQFLWNTFCQYVKRKHLISTYPSPKFKTLLDECLTRRSGRYLMLIAENESVIDYVEHHIVANRQTESVRTLTGSCFSGDLISDAIYTKEYNYRVLMDIILYAETSTTLIMRRMGHLYDNLYDLFNQNFAISAGKKYCRIPLGPLYHPRCLVNENFYCVVFIQKQDLPKCDPPFLNRFEKHIIDMDSLVHPCHKAITSDLLAWLADLLASNSNKYFPLLQHLFVNYNTDYICNLVIDAYNQLNIPIDHRHERTDAVIAYCKDKLILTSSFDLPLLLSLRSNDKEMIDPLIQQYYDTHKDLSFSNIIQQKIKQEQMPIPNQVVYTYTQLHDVINYDENSNNVVEVKLGNFKTELELTRRIRAHYALATQPRLLLIRVDYHLEHKHILLLKHILLNQRVKNSNRGVWIIFHLQRNMLSTVTNDILFNGWDIIMIENLNKHELIPQRILLNPSYRDLIDHEDFRLSECEFVERINRCLTRFRYTVTNQQNEVYINNRRDNIIAAINRENSSLSSIIQNNLEILMNTIPSRSHDWRRDLFTNGMVIGTSRSLSNAIQQIISLFYDNYLFLLFAHLEKYRFIDSYLFLNSKINSNIHDHLERIWHECLTSTLKSIDIAMMNIDVMELTLTSELYLPCARAEYEIIVRIREMTKEYLQNKKSADDTNNIILDDFSIDRLNKMSMYKCNFPIIIQNLELFSYYHHDQLVLALDEAKLYRLSPLFVQQLLTINPTRSTTDLLKDLLDYHTELIEILRLFEMTQELIGEDALTTLISKEQLIIDNCENVNMNKTSIEFYRLAMKGEEFYLIPPQKLESNDEIFECKGDPLIELSLMNMIELIVSPISIDRFENIAQVNNTYGRIVQGVLSLDRYTIDNLEKLRSFASLARCITTLLPNDRALNVFKQACRRTNFDVKYVSCEAIHSFIDYLRIIINADAQRANENIIRDTLLKLENEFMKNWLVDHEDQYFDVLKSINRSNSNLWQYSARILTVIDQKLELLSKIKENDGQIPQNDDELTQFDKYLRQLNDSTCKIERLMVNRIHMRLILSVQGQETVENILTQDFIHFEENIRQMENEKFNHGSQLISLTAWLKYYAQLYAFALNNDSKTKVMENIDKLLTRINSRFGSTLKLFIIKQLCQLFTVSINGLRDIFINRICTWIRPIIIQPNVQQAQEIRHNLVLPTPLFECREEFIRVNKILSRNANIDHLRQLITDCLTRYDTTYCFFIWFIHFYSRFYIADTRPDNHLRHLIEEELHVELVDCFKPIGYKLLIGLCTNFNNTSYFSLEPTMSKIEVHQRMLSLNISALLLSFKALSHTSYLSSFFFDRNLEMPQNYTQYLQSSVCLPGLMCSNPIITQMIDVRTQVEERLKKNKISGRGKNIFQCSKECLWMFYFENCGRANDKSLCPLCKKPIGAIKEGVLIERDPPQIQMSIEQAFDFINSYIAKFNQTTIYGYHNIISAEQSNSGEKSDHLNLPISFRFIHMFTHAVLLFLHEFDLLPNFNIPNHEYFREHFEKDCTLFGQQLANPEQSMIWLFKMINHMIDKVFLVDGFLDNNVSVIELEKLIEENLILPHIRSATDEISQYKLAYTDFVRQGDEEDTFDVFVQELKENEQVYPHLNFFNVTTVHTVNPLNEFLVKIHLIPDVEKAYPVTAFLMKRLDMYANIQYLYSIVTFTNYLIEKYNYRIKRIDASEKTIDYYLKKDDPDYETLLQLYQNFVHAWYKLTFNKVQFGCQTAILERTGNKEDFAKNSKFAIVLLNTSKETSSIALAGCLKTMAELQNEIVNFYHGIIYADTQMQRTIPLQAIQLEHVLRLDAAEISTKLITNGFTINYNYGKSKEIIYDYEEIESTLRNMISALPLINVENLHYFNYQFELYGENSSLINHVRARVKQEPLDINEHAKLKGLIHDMSNDIILNYLGSLDYVFTYLRNIDMTTIKDSVTIEEFIRINISSAACLNENVLRRPPFSTVNLKHVIGLYELLEECTFDQVLRNYIKSELSEEYFTNEQRTEIVDDFIKMTLEKETLADCFRHIDCWISMFKRLMIRVLMNTNVGVDVPLQLYLERTDLWTGNVTETDIQSIEVHDRILLQHTYIILRGLERKRDKTLPTTVQRAGDEQQNDNNTNPQTSAGQMHQAKAWMPTISAVPIEISETKKKPGKKLRDKN